MPTPNALPFVVLFAVLPALSGCEMDPADPCVGPFGAPQISRLLRPFAGSWTFDKAATLRARSGTDSGATDEPQTDNPQGGDVHPDMVITGNVAVFKDVVHSEYWFFALHPHDGKVCGKAWHHEDRFDPGDMSKCGVRFELRDDRLRFEVRMKEAAPEVDDPDLTTVPPIEVASAADCDAEALSGGGWTPWSIYIFTRARPDSR
jgi:hypothetical protein